MTAARTARYEKIAALLASRSDFELVELMGPGRVTSVGVGGESGILDVDGLPVFTKRIPLSDREIANVGSTANLFDLPMFCQYGMADRVSTRGASWPQTSSSPTPLWPARRNRSRCSTTGG